MPRFYFHVYDGVSKMDGDGHILSGLAEARTEAIKLAGRTLSDDAQRIAIGEDWHLEVTDENGLILLHMHFFVVESAAVTHAKAHAGELP